MDYLNSIYGNDVSVLDGRVTVKNESALKSDKTDKLVRAAVFGDKDEKLHARWLLWEIGQAVGVQPASIHDLYMARGRGEIRGFTVPAINVRGLSYDTGRSIFRTAIKLKAGAFILEIARSEIGYTDQRPAEYVSVMIADVKLDLDTLERLSKVAREEYKLAGAVQHGASTLSDDAFHNFPKREVCEIHLATNFQSMLYDALPASLRDEVYAWLRENAKDERKPQDSDEQFFYKTRKKALGPFKKKFWDLPDDVRSKLGQAYDKKFAFLFEQLAVGGTATYVQKYVKAPTQHRPQPAEGHVAVAAAPDDTSLSD